MRYRIVAETYEPHEMAQVKVNGRVVHMGNYWDFHPGCQGTEMYIDGFKDEIIDGKCVPKGLVIDLEDIWDGRCSPKTLANLIAMKLKDLGHEVVVESKERKTPINC